MSRRPGHELERDGSVFVAASTECWPEREFKEAIDLLADLEFTAIEIAIHESGNIKPSELLPDMDRAIQLLRGREFATGMGDSVTYRVQSSEYREYLNRVATLTIDEVLILYTIDKIPKTCRSIEVPDMFFQLFF